MRKGEELKAPRYASATALCNNHVTIYNIIPNNIVYLNYIKSILAYAIKLLVYTEVLKNTTLFFLIL